jgi:hypothetical protein
VILVGVWRAGHAVPRREKVTIRRWDTHGEKQKPKRDSSTAQADAFVPQYHPGRKKRAGANEEEKTVGLLRSE